MKVLAVVASPLGKGNTYGVVKNIETHLRRIDAGLEFECVVLKDINLKTCIGCFQCLAKGEEHCPLNDQRAEIEAKMAACDGLIFASPVYVYNMSWTAKNFVDRFAYICHRPRFHGKKAMVVATTGAVGLGFTLFCLAFPIMSWGFQVVSHLGVKCPLGPITPEEAAQLGRKTEKAIEKAAMKFYRKLTAGKKLRPNIIHVVEFMMQKKAFAKAEKGSADYCYWQSKGWLTPKINYYCDAKVGLFKRWLGRLITRVVPF